MEFRLLPLLLLPALLALALLPLAATACRVLTLESAALSFLSGDYELSSWHTTAEEGGEEERYSHHGRPVYVSMDPDAPRRFLFHIPVEEHQGGRWLVGASVGVNGAWAYVESWATQPALVPLVSDQAVWRVFIEGEGWQEDAGFRAVCRAPEGDATVYIEAPKLPTLAGTYSLTDGQVDGRPLYAHARDGLYLYSRLGDRGRTWIIGGAPGDGSGLAFLQEEQAGEGEGEGPPHPPMGAGRGWRVAVEGEWLEDDGIAVVTSDPALCVEAALRHAPTTPEAEARAACERLTTTWEVVRSLRLAPKLPAAGAAAAQPAHHHLSNGVPLPIVGFGAGATAREHSAQTVQQALETGYTLIDGAIAYDNSDLIGDLLASGAVPGVGRHQVFLTSKLWYTELGFTQALDAAARALEDFRSDYLDLLLIHWPQCHSDVEWMKCDELPEGVGTWKETWRALERLYAEGAVLAVGVSNYDAPLLRELAAFASTSPQVVQNHRDVLWQDGGAAAAAAELGLFYQAYSSLRGLMEDQPQYAHARQVLTEIGARHNKSAAQVALRWEIQHGHGIIPRSHHPERLAQNLDVLGFSLSEQDMAAIDVLSVEPRGPEHEEL